MTMNCDFCFPFFASGSSHPCDHRSGHRGWHSHNEGGPGGEANRVARPAGDITCLACLAHFLAFRFRSFFYQFRFHLVSFFRTFLSHFSLNPHSAAFGFLILILSLNVLPGCATRYRADAQMLRVVDGQVNLLENLKEERRHPELLKRLHRDEDITKAEEHLRESIDALIRANEELRMCIKNK